MVVVVVTSDHCYHFALALAQPLAPPPPNWSSTPLSSLLFLLFLLFLLHPALLLGGGAPSSYYPHPGKEKPNQYHYFAQMPYFAPSRYFVPARECVVASEERRRGWRGRREVGVVAKAIVKGNDWKKRRRRRNVVSLVPMLALALAPLLLALVLAAGLALHSVRLLLGRWIGDELELQQPQ